MRARAIVAGLVFSASTWGCRHQDEAGQPGQISESASVGTAKIDTGTVEECLDAYGKVEFATERQRSVTFLRPGLVMAVPMVEGQVVRKSDELLRVGRVPRGSPEVRLATIAADFAERELARIKRLVDEKLATNQELQSAEKQLATANAALQALGGGGTGTDGTSIGAPMDGVVAKVMVHRGDLVQAGQTGVVIAARDSMSVRAGFEVEDLSRLLEGLTVRIESAYRGANDKVAEARLSALHRVVDPRTQLVEGVIRVNDPPVWMAPGLSVHVVVVLAARREVARVPREALLERGGSTGVFAIESGRAKWRALTLGLRGAESIELLSGLRIGEDVATTGRTSLSDGMAVRLAARDRP